MKQTRRTSPPKVVSERVQGTTGSATDMVAKKAREKMEFREKIRQLLQAGRSEAASSAPPSPQKVAPFGARKREASQEQSKRAAAVAVIEAVSLIDASKKKEEFGKPDDPGKTFDELHAACLLEPD